MREYFKQVFDSKSPASFGRHACFMVLVWCMISGWWVMADDWHSKKDLFIPDIPTQWIVVILALFGIAVGKEVATTFATKSQPPAVPPQPDPQGVPQ
jgi:hypothetical protein